jgi:pimeloyl-ACP methyl ester carboxylesterase
MPNEHYIQSTQAPTLFLDGKISRYAYRRFGTRRGLPLLCLQHFTGTLDNWDPALTELLAANRDLVLFENAGVGRSAGHVPNTVSEMAATALDFMTTLGMATYDVLGFSLGGMVAQQLLLEAPTKIRRAILVGTAPRGGEDIMHLEKPELAVHFANKELHGYSILQRIFFNDTATSQLAGEAFIRRLMCRGNDREPVSGPAVAKAQLAAFRDWEQANGERFGELKQIHQPILVVNGVHDAMISVRNSYWLAEYLPNAALLVYPDSGHGSLFQFHAEFGRQAIAFLESQSPYAPY